MKNIELIKLDEVHFKIPLELEFRQAYLGMC